MEFSAQGEYEVRIEGRVLVATAGGCLASPYLAAWLIARSKRTAVEEA